MVIEPQPGFGDSQSRVEGLLLAMDSCVYARSLIFVFQVIESVLCRGVCVRFVWRRCF